MVVALAHLTQTYISRRRGLKKTEVMVLSSARTVNERKRVKRLGGYRWHVDHHGVQDWIPTVVAVAYDRWRGQQQKERRGESHGIGYYADFKRRQGPLFFRTTTKMEGGPERAHLGLSQGLAAFWQLSRGPSEQQGAMLCARRCREGPEKYAGLSSR